MKITPEDMDAIRTVLAEAGIGTCGMDEQRDLSLALILRGIYDRGYVAGYTDRANDDIDLGMDNL